MPISVPELAIFDKCTQGENSAKQKRELMHGRMQKCCAGSAAASKQKQEQEQEQAGLAVFSSGICDVPGAAICLYLH